MAWACSGLWRVYCSIERFGIRCGQNFRDVLLEVSFLVCYEIKKVSQYKSTYFISLERAGVVPVLAIPSADSLLLSLYVQKWRSERYGEVCLPLKFY